MEQLGKMWKWCDSSEITEMLLNNRLAQLWMYLQENLTIDFDFDNDFAEIWSTNCCYEWDIQSSR